MQLRKKHLFYQQCACGALNNWVIHSIALYSTILRCTVLHYTTVNWTSVLLETIHCSVFCCSTCQFHTALYPGKMPCYHVTLDYTLLCFTALYLYSDERRDILWNIAWAQGKSQRRSPRYFPRAQDIYYCISDLSHRTDILNYNSSIALSFLGEQYSRSWFFELL